MSHISVLSKSPRLTSLDLSIDEIKNSILFSFKNMKSLSSTDLNRLSDSLDSSCHCTKERSSFDLHDSSQQTTISDSSASPFTPSKDIFQ